MAAKDTDTKKPEENPDAGGTMLDMSQAAVKKMMGTARARGYITYDELNEVLPPDQVTSEQIEDVMAMLSEMGINVIEGDDADDEDRRDEPPQPTEDEASGSREITIASTASETLDRTDDPVRMYLREMGSVELLSREGEIAIAKRIEAGRNTMIAGLCESPLTFQAITIWRDELLDGAIMLRDVIDLETTFSGQMESDEVASVITALDAVADAPPPPRREEPAPAPAPAPVAAGSDDEEDEDEDTPAPVPDPDDDDEDEQGNLSLAAMEAALKPQVLETLSRIAGHYGRLAEMQDDRISATLNRDTSFTTTQERDYQRLRSEIVELVNSLHLHNNRIEALVDQLYGINRKIMTLDGAMVSPTPPAP
jgi:RNA polymerase primary sigma factor